MDTPTLLRPVVSLVGWTFFMEAWMYRTRIPAVSKYKLKISPEATSSEMAKLPANIRWKADNYNHLHEAPVRFYAITLALALLQTTSAATADTALETNLAWTYVGLRVVHSLIQVITNTIMVRFSVYITSECVMLGLFARLVYLVV